MSYCSPSCAYYALVLPSLSLRMHLPTTLSLLFLLSTIISALPYPDASPDAKVKQRDDDDDDNDNDCSSESEGPELARCSLTPPPSLPSSSLPPPSTGLTLKHIVLGRGTQNYTCDSSTSAPIAAGAVASLYDISCLTSDPKVRSTLSNYIVPYLLSMPSTQIESYLASRVPAPNVGVHYFRDGTTPFFAVGGGEFAAVGKVAGSAAPTSATGNQNGAAVDWLKLARKPYEAQGGIEEVFRVGTAGGRAPANCTAAGTMTVDYVAEYWMYGPPR